MEAAAQLCYRAIPFCHSNPCKASANHKDKAQLVEALFGAPYRMFCPFRTFASKQLGCRASRGASQSRTRKREHLPSHPSCAGDPSLGSFPRKRQTSGVALTRSGDTGAQLLR